MTLPTQVVEHLIIPKDRVPTAAYQAIYHKLTSKVEKLSQIFDDAYEVGVNDIVQLDERFRQVIKQYPVQGENAECTLSLRKDEKMTTSSVEKFRTLNFTTNKPTASISYLFDFFTVLPVEIKEAEDIVQRFKVSVVVDQDFMEDIEGGIPFLSEAWHPEAIYV